MEFYYIKIIADEYDKMDTYLTDDEIISINPKDLMVFDYIDAAIVAKQNLINRLRKTWPDYPVEYIQICRL